MPAAPEPLSDAGLEQLLINYSTGDLDAAYSTSPAPRLLATLDQQTRRLNAVRALHRARQCDCSDPDCTAHTLADCCYGEEWPCPTARALNA